MQFYKYLFLVAMFSSVNVFSMEEGGGGSVDYMRSRAERYSATEGDSEYSYQEVDLEEQSYRVAHRADSPSQGSISSGSISLEEGGGSDLEMDYQKELEKPSKVVRRVRFQDEEQSAAREDSDSDYDDQCSSAIAIKKPDGSISFIVFTEGVDGDRSKSSAMAAEISSEPAISIKYIAQQFFYTISYKHRFEEGTEFILREEDKLTQEQLLELLNFTMDRRTYSRNKKRIKFQDAIHAAGYDLINSDAIGHTLLSYAAEEDSTSLARPILNAIQKIHDPEDRRRILNKASGKHYTRTALMNAAHNRNEELIDMLLKAGADSDFKNNVGCTAYDDYQPGLLERDYKWPHFTNRPYLPETALRLKPRSAS